MAGVGESAGSDIARSQPRWTGLQEEVMLETRMGGVRDIVQEAGLPHVLCFQARRMPH